jgi:hypothetical protein
MLNRSNVREALQYKPECLSIEELESLLDGSKSHPHLETCPRCRAELAMLRSFESDVPVPGEGRAANKTSWLTQLVAGRGRWLVPATALVVMVVVGYAVLHRPQEPDLRASSGNGPVVYRTQELQVIEPVGEVPSGPETLRWQAFPGASGYQVSVMEIDQTILWHAQTHDQSLTIPVAVRDKMLPGKPLLWRVEAVDSQGRVVASSQVQRFSVQRKPATSAVVPDSH